VTDRGRALPQLLVQEPEVVVRIGIRGVGRERALASAASFRWPRSSSATPRLNAAAACIGFDVRAIR
jgi:hypothetical protein